TAPRLDEYDLCHLGRFHAAIRTVRNGAEAPAYTLRTEPLPPPLRDHAPALTGRPVPGQRPVALAKDLGTKPADPRRAP
ncbi:hypothetical protein ADK76_28815, partial [Streptomyces griseoflavus]